MLKSLAVLLIGQYRSWPTVSKYILNFFKYRAENVDYFFVTWDVDWKGNAVNEQEILKHFVNEPVTIKIVPDINESNTFYRAAYLAKQANLLKKRKELTQGFVYEQVVETRHDLYIRRNSSSWLPCYDYEYQIGSISARDTADKINPLVITDIYLRSNSFTNDILSNRYVKSKLADTKYLDQFTVGSNIKFTDNHHLLADYLMENRLTQIWSHGPDYSFSTPVRKDPEVDLDQVPIGDLDKVIVLCNFV